MNRNDLTNRLLNAAIVASVVIAVALYAYYEWQPVDPGPPETQMQVPGPVEPVPKIENHVAAVTSTMTYNDKLSLRSGDPSRLIDSLLDGDCVQLKDGVMQKTSCATDCPTYETLKRAGVEIICTNAFGEVPSVNYWPVEVGMACSRIKEVRITNDKIKVIGGKK